MKVYAMTFELSKLAANGIIVDVQLCDPDLHFHGQ